MYASYILICYWNNICGRIDNQVYSQTSSKFLEMVDPLQAASANQEEGWMMVPPPKYAPQISRRAAKSCRIFKASYLSYSHGEIFLAAARFQRCFSPRQTGALLGGQPIFALLPGNNTRGGDRHHMGWVTHHLTYFRKNQKLMCSAAVQKKSESDKLRARRFFQLLTSQIGVA